MTGKFVIAALFLLSSGPAFAGESSEREQALGLCRSAIAADAGVAADDSAVHFRESRTTPRLVKLRFSVTGADGKSFTANCDVKRDALVVTKVTYGAGAPLKVANTDTK